MDTENEIRKLLTFRGNVRAIKKKLKYLHGAAKAVGKIHQWRASELQEIVDKMIGSVDDRIATLCKHQPRQPGVEQN